MTNKRFVPVHSNVAQVISKAKVMLFSILFYYFATPTTYEIKSISWGCNCDCHALFTDNQQSKDSNI